MRTSNSWYSIKKYKAETYKVSKGIEKMNVETNLGAERDTDDVLFPEDVTRQIHWHYAKTIF
jgi:hypothetical protein